MNTVTSPVPTIEIVTPSTYVHELVNVLRDPRNAGYRLVVAKVGEIYIYAKLTRRNAVAKGFRGMTEPVVFGHGKKFSELIHWPVINRHSGTFFNETIEDAVEREMVRARATYGL